MRIRAGSQAKTGMAEEKETKGIDYQTCLLYTSDAADGL